MTRLNQPHGSSRVEIYVNDGRVEKLRKLSFFLLENGCWKPTQFTMFRIILPYGLRSIFSAITLTLVFHFHLLLVTQWNVFWTFNLWRHHTFFGLVGSGRKFGGSDFFGSQQMNPWTSLDWIVCFTQSMNVWNAKLKCLTVFSLFVKQAYPELFSAVQW